MNKGTTATLAFALFSLFGCATEVTPAQSAADSTPLADRAEGMQKIVAASDETSAELAVDKYEVWAESERQLRIVALSADGESKGEFTVDALDENGEVARDADSTAAVAIALVAPFSAILSVSVIDDAVLEDTFPPGSYELQLARALERDFSTQGNADAPALSSSDNVHDQRTISGPGCFTDTKCKFVVMLCTDKCCNGVAYGDDGLPKGVDCTTIKKRHVCGACIGADF